MFVDHFFGGWFGWGVLTLLVPLIALGLFVGMIVLIVRLAIKPGSQPAVPSRESGATRILEERYARGEIDREEFLERRAVLHGESPT